MRQDLKEFQNDARELLRGQSIVNPIFASEKYRVARPSGRGNGATAEMPTLHCSLRRDVYRDRPFGLDRGRYQAHSDHSLHRNDLVFFSNAFIQIS